MRHGSLADNLAEFRIKIEDLETEKATTDDSLKYRIFLTSELLLIIPTCVFELNRSLRAERDTFAEQVAALQRQVKSLTEELSGAHLQLRDALSYRKEYV